MRQQSLLRGKGKASKRKLCGVKENAAEPTDCEWFDDSSILSKGEFCLKGEE